MTESLESIYGSIGRLMAGKLPAAWIEARVIAEEVDTGVFEWRGEYIPSTGQAAGEFVVGPEIASLVMLVRQRMAATGKASWQRSTITLKPDGQFNMAFDY